jgi:hypothetical protein
MAQKKKTKKKKKKTTKLKSTKAEMPPVEPWISMRTGLIVITLLSVAMFLFVIWQTSDSSLTLSDRVTVGLVRGGAIWVIFLLVILFNRFIRNR